MRGVVLDPDALFLSRIQFAFVVAFHFLLPAFTIGLASYIAVLEGLYLATNNPVYLRVSNYWIKIFAVSFGMGVVSGIVMPFQFGTNWSRYSHMTADIVAPLMAYEGLTAFFLEAGFLGVLLFGRKLVPSWAHFFAAVMVAIGTLMSTFWILVVNSWMQTPTGFSIEHGRFYPGRLDRGDLQSVVSVPLHAHGGRRLPHHRVHRHRRSGVPPAQPQVRRGKPADDGDGARARHAAGAAAGVAGRPARAQHAAASAAEARGDGRHLGHAAAASRRCCSRIPDEKTESNRLEISIPKLASLYLTHDWNGVVKGLKDFPAADRPPVAPVFFAFRIMIGMWAVMLAITRVELVARVAQAALRQPAGSCACARGRFPVGYVAVTAGWVTTEVGRQPWVVYNQLRTADAVTPNLAGHDVVISLALYVLVYAVVFGAGAYYLFKLVRAGPAIAAAPEPGPAQRPARPLSAAE